MADLYYDSSSNLISADRLRSVTHNLQITQIQICSVRHLGRFCYQYLGYPLKSETALPL